MAKNKLLTFYRKNSILDFNCQPLGRVPICFMSVGPHGPEQVLSHFEGEGGVCKVYSRKDPNIDGKRAMSSIIW